MNVKQEFDKNKKLYTGILLLLAAFFVTGTALIIIWYRKKQMGHTKQNGIQDSTIDFITEVEGREYKVYKDTAGHDTIGVGHLIKPNEAYLKNKTLNDNEVDALLKSDMARAASEIQRNIKDPDVFTQNEFDALVSLFFNIGEGAFEGSTLFKELNKPVRNDDLIKSAWLAWKYSGGKPNLLSRREKEVELFYS